MTGKAETARRRRKAARPGEIVEAARHAFIERGFSETRIDDIAARAGVSKGLVYVYFPSKEALFEAVVRATVLPVLDRAAALIAASDAIPSATLLRLMIETIYREMVDSERRRLIHRIVAEAPRFPEMARFYHGEVITKGRNLLRTLVDRGIARGEFTPSPMSLYPEIAIAPALLAAIWKMLFDPYEPLDSAGFMDAHLAVMLKALGAETQAPRDKPQ